jgi:ribosomal protein L31E
MAEEKVLVLNLRKESLKTPKWRRGKDIVSILRRRVARISKSENVRIDPKINELFWSRGPKMPEKILRVKIKKSDDGKVTAELA